MAILFHCTCGRPLKANNESAGKKTKCPGCQAVLIIPNASGKVAAAAPVSSPAIATSPTVPGATPDDPFALSLDWSTLETRATASASETDLERSNDRIKIDTGVAGAILAEIPRTEDGSKQYHVLTQKDQGFSGKFNAAKLEELLNSRARQGWELKAAVTMNIPGHGGSHDELIVILER